VTSLILHFEFHAGIGRTVKEKVCVHTSRDIRAIARQLVSVWIEVLRKEKASNGGLKLLRRTPSIELSKDLQSGKPGLRVPNESSDNNKVASQRQRARFTSSHSPPKASKNFENKERKLETGTVGRSDDNSFSQKQQHCNESKVEHGIPMSEEEAAAIAAAEAARAAAIAAAQVCD